METSKETLSKKVDEYLLPIPSFPPFIVKGDGEVAYKRVIDLMVLLQDAGVPSLGLMTEPESE